ncbi:hypothetical protein O181_029327 [Austropuccinia psidii MF-1]|uniref:Uncharacterized protein n=1 Tax=Austropuccinia psidii MF-1 TaxID=1389203 RepID=A0A9Q3H3F0_9BASI|nr:hypothetical protein [Austropuccinia psidii MF-1]
MEAAALLHYDTFKALKADYSIPSQTSFPYLIQLISFSLLRIHAILKPLLLTHTEPHGFSEGKHHLADIPPPKKAFFSAVQNILDIFRQMESELLGPIIKLSYYVSHQKHTQVYSSAFRRASITRNFILSFRNGKLTHQLAASINRIRSRLKAFVYWSDNVFLASLANVSRPGDLRKSALPGESELDNQAFAGLIDSCVDTVQYGWLIIAQLARAHNLLMGSRRSSKRLPQVSRARKFLKTKPSAFSSKVPQSYITLAPRQRHFRSARRVRKHCLLLIRHPIFQLLTKLNLDVTFESLRAARTCLEKTL